MTLAVHTVRKIAHRHAALADLGLILAGSLVVAASAQVRFFLPQTPVPVTLQTLAILLVGAALGTWRGMTSVILYIAAGILGLPFFAGLNGGTLALLGPTGGYLLGFVLAAGSVGWLAEHQFGRTLSSSILMFVAGQMVIYLFGILWLSGFVGGLNQAVFAGFLPFVLGDALKLTAAIWLLPTVWRLTR